jgi:glycerol kinase
MDMKDKEFIMAIDQGSTATKVILINKSADIVEESDTSFDINYPASGWVEFDALSVIDSVMEGIKNIMDRSGVSPEKIRSIGITNQRESVIIWDKNTGIPVGPGISWQCKRSTELCNIAKSKGCVNLIRERTGLFLDSYYSASKIKWIFENDKSLSGKIRDLKFGNIDSWIIWNLTRGKSHCTDVSNASRTLLMNIRTGAWDRDLLELWDVPESILPEIKMSCDDFGYMDTSITGCPIPINGCIGDAQSSLFGLGAFEKFSAVNTYGTASNMDINIGKDFLLSKNKIQTTVAWGLNSNLTYAFEGGVFTSGSVINWLKDKMNLIKDGKEADEVSERIKDTKGVYFMPAFVGLSAPYWDPYARGTIVGLSNNTGKEEIIRAAMESIAFQVSDILVAAEKDIGGKIQVLKVTGGVSKSDFVLQFQSDISNLDVVRYSVTHATALGAAFMAGLKCGYWADEKEISKLLKPAKVFSPKMPESDREEILKNWTKAAVRSLNWLN